MRKMTIGAIGTAIAALSLAVAALTTNASPLGAASPTPTVVISNTAPTTHFGPMYELYPAVCGGDGSVPVNCGPAPAAGSDHPGSYTGR